MKTIDSKPTPDNAEASALFELENVSICRGDTAVYEGLSLKIELGESVAIIGPNGSGKSTLIKLLSRGIYPVQQANSRFRLLGRERVRVDDYRKRLGYVAEDALDLVPMDTSVLEICISAFTGSSGLRGVPQRPPAHATDNAMQALAFVGLAGFQQRQLQNLSTGECRRLMLARAMCHKPLAIILDEPSSNLDLQASAWLTDRLGQLASTGTSIVLATHLINEIPPEITRIIAIREGRIVGDDAAVDLLSDDFVSNLYATDVRVYQHDGFFVTVPANRSKR